MQIYTCTYLSFSRVKSPAKKTNRPAHSSDHYRGEIRWLSWIDALEQRQLCSEIQFGLITQIDKQWLNDEYRADTFIWALSKLI